MAEDEASVFRALADPTRRQILQDLRGGELSAGDIASRFPIRGPSVSRHLSILKGAGLISERREANRILYSRADPVLLASFLPAPFRPALVGGYGVAGICLIRLAKVRPAGVPAVAGLASENAAHRVAVRWDGPDGPVTGVYIPRRDTSSRLAALAGGRLFPGWQHLARFRADAHEGRFRVQAASRDGMVRILVAGHLTDDLAPGSIFTDLGAASRFFRCAPVGYAATPADGVYDGVKLETAGWTL